MATPGTLYQPGEHDWLKVLLAGNQAYEIAVTGLTNDANIEVGTSAALDEGSIGLDTSAPMLATPAAQTVWFTPETTGTYYIDVSDPGTAQGSYSVSAAAVTSGFTDNTTTAGSVTVGGVATPGTLYQPGEHDWLKVLLAANQAYEIAVTGLTNDANIEVGTSAALDEGSIGLDTSVPMLATPAVQTVWFTPETTGTYYIDVSDPGTAQGSYSVSAAAVTSGFTDNTTTAGTVTVGGVATLGTLYQPGEHDWLKVLLAGNQAYEIAVTGLTNDANIEVGTSAALDEGSIGLDTSAPMLATPAAQTVWFTPETTGTYYIDVSDPGTAQGSYSVSAAAVTSGFTDNTTTAGSVTVGGVATPGTLYQPGEHDWLKVLLAGNQAYEIAVTGLTNDANIEVGTSAALDEGSIGLDTSAPMLATPAAQTVWFTPETTGTYYIDVSDPGTAQGSYSVSAAAVTSGFTDNTTTAGSVTVGGVATPGTLYQPGEHDWLKVLLAANQAYEIAVTGLTNDANIEVGTSAALDEGSIGLDTSVPMLATPAVQTVWFTPETTGTYYIDVSDPGTAQGSYSVSAAAVTSGFTDNTTTAGTVTVSGIGVPPPAISGTASGQAVTDLAVIAPFSSVMIADVNSGQIETVMVALSAAANGTLSNLGGGSYDASTGVYTDAGTAAAVTTALDGLVFTPTARQVAVGQTVTTTFTITDTDTLGASATDSSTTVIATAVAVPPLIVNNSDGTSYLYTYNPTSTVTETIATYSGANATGTMISDIVDNSDGTSLLYAYNPTSTVTLTASEYSGTNTTTGAPSGSQISDVVDNTNGTSLVYAYNPTSTVTQTAQQWSGTDPTTGAPTGTLISDVVNNTNGTTLVYAYNPTSTVTQTTSEYSGTNPANGAPAGTLLSDVVDNTNGTSIVYAYNPSSTVTQTASFYSGTDTATGAPSGTLTSETFDYTSGGSSITTYNSNGTSSTVYYSGPDGTGTIIPAITSAPQTSSAVISAAASVTSTPTPAAQAEPAPDSNVIMISGSDQRIDPGAGNHSIQFISSAADDTLVLHSGGSDQVTGFNPTAGDQLDLSSLLAEAHVSLADISQLGSYVSVANINGAAQILFDPTGHGAGSQVALLLNDGSLATQIQTSILAQHIT